MYLSKPKSRVHNDNIFTENDIIFLTENDIIFTDNDIIFTDNDIIMCSCPGVTRSQEWSMNLLPSLGVGLFELKQFQFGVFTNSARQI